MKSRGGVEAAGVSRKTAYDWLVRAGIVSGWRRYDGKGEECVREYGRPSERLTMGIRSGNGRVGERKSGWVGRFCVKLGPCQCIRVRVLSLERRWKGATMEE